MEELQSCINAIHDLMKSMPDAKHVAILGKSLQGLLQVQADLAAAGPHSQSPRDAMLAQLGGQ